MSEGATLLGRRREIPVIVEAAFPGRDRHRIGEQLREPRRVAFPQRRRMMRVHAGGRAQHVRESRHRAMARALSSSVLPVTIIATTPACRARAITSARSRS